MLTQIGSIRISLFRSDVLLLETTHRDRPGEKSVVMMSIVELHGFDKSNAAHFVLVNPFISDEVQLRTIISYPKQEKRKAIWPPNTVFLVIKVGDTIDISPYTSEDLFLTQLWHRLRAIRDPLLKTVSPTIKYTILQKRLLQKAHQSDYYYDRPEQVFTGKFGWLMMVILIILTGILITLIIPKSQSEALSFLLGGGIFIGLTFFINIVKRRKYWSNEDS